MTLPASASASAPASSDLPTLSATTKTMQKPSPSTSSPTPTIIHQLSIPLPDAPYTRLRIHLSILQTTIMLFLTTTTSMADMGVDLSTSEAHASNEGGSKEDNDTERNPDEQTESLGQRSRPAALAPMGSFVYAMPDLSTTITNSSSSSATSKQPLTTPLYPQPPSTIDFATRCARVLAHRLRRPTYVGNSISEMDLGMTGIMAGRMRLDGGGGNQGAGGTDAFAGGGAGGGETSVLKRIVDVVVDKVLKAEEEKRK